MLNAANYQCFYNAFLLMQKSSLRRNYSLINWNLNWVYKNKF